MRDNKFDAFCLNETKLDGSNKKEFEIFNYQSIFRNRNRKGGGEAIMVKKGIKFEEINDFKNLIKNIRR